jgi:putative transposase
MMLAHQIALDLTPAQERYCRQAAGTARFTYNWALAEWTRQRQAGEKPTALRLKAQWNALKYQQYPWLKGMHRDAHTQPFTHLGLAFGKFFRHEAKFPTFKKKGTRDSFYIANDKARIKGKRLRIPKLGWVRMREALRFSGQVMSVTVSRLADRWFANVAVRLTDPPPPCENQAVMGIDLGVATLATLSTGQKVVGPKPLRRLQKALRRCSKELSRKVKGSANRAKAKRKFARLHYRIACQRTDALHKLTTALVQGCGTVVIEDLHVAGMVKNRSLARAISDMGFGMFRRMLAYKAELRGVQVVIADRWFPSSKLCSQCGALKDTLALAARVFQCDNCGFVSDRDLNAALNLANYPRLRGEVTPMDIGALTPAQCGRETPVSEVGTTKDALLCTL